MKAEELKEQLKEVMKDLNTIYWKLKEGEWEVIIVESGYRTNRGLKLLEEARDKIMEIEEEVKDSG